MSDLFGIGGRELLGHRPQPGSRTVATPSAAPAIRCCRHVGRRDVQIAARHADPRTTMRYDRARKNLDRHPNYILAAYMASGT